MYRVLLVDDEPLARIGVKSTFDWEANGLTVVGEESNGRKAMRWIERDEVDILITDIAMPVMDGLELMRRARERCPRIKVILLSCHSDFEYVREGVRLGASDYLLKPTLEPADLENVLGKVKLELAEERKRNELYTRQELSDKRQELEKSLMKLMAGEAAGMDWGLELPWTASGYRVAVCLLDGADKLLAEEGGIFLEIVIDETQECAYDFLEQGIAFRAHMDQLLLLLPAPERASSESEERLRSLQTLLKDKGRSFTLGVSTVYSGVEHLKQAYREAREAAQLRFYYGPGTIRFAEENPEYVTPRKEAAGWKHAMKNAIQEGFRENASNVLEHVAQQWTVQQRSPSEVVREAQEVLALFRLCRPGLYMSLEQTEALRTMETLEELRRLLRSAFEQLWHKESGAAEETGLHQRIIESAIDYMKGNFTQNISLQDVADHVAVSKNYFSEMFKRVTGQNFIDYLIHLRLKRARVLLTTTTLKVYEVAEKSGFNDVKYFSKLFRKVLKMSPAEFREKGIFEFGKHDTIQE